MNLKYNLIAHRGYFDNSKNIPENSLKAFKRAIKYNFIIEFDIRKTKDDVLVVFHDDKLKRMCGINKSIENCTYSELKKLYLNNTTSKIPTFEETLELISGKVPIIIELKGNNKYGVIETLAIKLLDKYKGEYAIQSFDPLNLLWFKKNRPNITRGLIKSIKSNKRIGLLKVILSSKYIVKPNYYSVDVKLKKKKNSTLVGWTIRTKEEYDRYKGEYYNLVCENMNLYKVE